MLSTIILNHKRKKQSLITRFVSLILMPITMYRCSISVSRGGCLAFSTLSKPTIKQTHARKCLFRQSNELYMSSSSSSTSSSDINKLTNRNQLSNQYYALRHGQSKANIAKIISSDPSISTIEHGLTDLGKEQVFETAKQFSINYQNDFPTTSADKATNADAPLPIVAIYSSDFTRARETAEIFSQILTQHNIPLLYDTPKLEARLRERYFGLYNAKSDDNYQNVWDIDCVDPTHVEMEVESVYSVVQRTTELITDIENGLNSINGEEEEKQDKGNQPYKVILVAHGDVLQILQTAFLKVDGSVHRSLEHLNTACVRELALKS